MKLELLVVVMCVLPNWQAGPKQKVWVISSVTSCFSHNCKREIKLSSLKCQKRISYLTGLGNMCKINRNIQPMWLFSCALWQSL